MFKWINSSAWLRLLAMGLAFFAAASPARADCGFGCVVNAVSSAVTGPIGVAQQAIVQTIKGLGEVQVQTQTEAAQAAADANTDALATMARTVNQRNWQIPDECGVTAGAHGVIDAQFNSPGKCNGRNCPAGAGGGGGGLSANQSQALAIAQGATPAPAPEVQAALASSGACASFVGSGSNSARMNRCQVANLPTGDSNGNPDADIRAETLFDGPQRDPSRMMKRYTISSDPTSSDYRAVGSLMRNLDTPLDLRDLKRAELTTDAGRRYLALRDAYDARMAVAQKPVSQLVANRMEDASLIGYVKQILTSPVHGSWVSQRLAKVAPNWQSRGISFDEMMDIEASRRFQNRDWAVQMASMSSEGHIREQTSMLAFQLYLMQQINQKLDVIAVASGQTAAASVRAELLPQLQAAHAAATK